ncbi:MAG: hypothetical protein M3273_04610 [Actinomycetota bacterium]|nr:hypothetical protein [Actinomycetota bacterium]
MFTRRKKLVAILSLAVIAGVLTLVAVGPAGGAETLRFRLAFRASEFHEIDNNSDGDTDDPGDQETGSIQLKRGGKKAGHLNFICVNSEVAPPRDLCTATIRVTGKGAVTVQGVAPNDTNRFRGAITGGTGAYRGASGVFELAFRKPSLTLRIID